MVQQQTYQAILQCSQTSKAVLEEGLGAGEGGERCPVEGEEGGLGEGAGGGE